MIISIHIPKTAGTTFGMYLENGFDHRIFFDYGNTVIWEDAFLERHKDLLAKFPVIHGHFRYAKYKDTFPDAKYITCLRDPVDRTISNYWHVMRDKDPGNFLYRRIAKHNMDLVDFANLPPMRKTQTILLRGRDITEYDFVGITEDLSNSIKLMCRMYNVPMINPCRVGRFFNFVPRVNVNMRARVTHMLGMDKINQDIRNKIREAVAEDYDLYQRGLSHYKNLQKKYL